MNKRVNQAACNATPDGRYLIVRGRLWRLANPALDPATRQHWVNELMEARRGVRCAKHSSELLASIRSRIERAKCALGERGPVWWTDGAPDFNRHMVANTPYAQWYAAAQPLRSANGDVGDTSKSEAMIEEEIRRLLMSRDAQASSCPSEVARSLCAGSKTTWRSLMSPIREVAKRLIRAGFIIATRKTRTLSPDQLQGGPIRLRRGARFNQWKR